MLIPAMVRFAVPGFCTAIVRLALDVPTVWVGKVRAEDEKDMSGTRGLIVIRTVFEIPPPGDGLVTVIDAVPAGRNLTGRHRSSQHRASNESCLQSAAVPFDDRTFSKAAAIQ